MAFGSSLDERVCGGARNRVASYGHSARFECWGLVLKKLWVAAAIFALCVIYVTDVHAGPTWIMDGKCIANSWSKVGQIADDFHSLPKQPIVCDVAIVSRLKNGGWFMQFTEKKGASNDNPVGFVSSVDGSIMNSKGSFKIPLVRVYPPQPLRAVGEDRVVFPAEGRCLVDTREISSAKHLSCASNTEKRWLSSDHVCDL